MRNRKPPQKMVTRFQEIFSRITNPLDAKDCGEGKNLGWQLAALDHCIQQLWCVTFSFFFGEACFSPFPSLLCCENIGGWGGQGQSCCKAGAFLFLLDRFVQLFGTSWTVACQAPLSMGFSSKILCPWDSPGKKTWVGCHSLLQGIFQPRDGTQVSRFCRWILYYQVPGKPKTGVQEA